ncbi:AAA family ATPase [Geoalkalibacter halelectricus]|uniref:ATP-binding protein n=1 Tax=Geoalkalibacter halelectricus TaxID=2847045 RepID=A0ABY5ZI63_9BACT|nr:ATP-binding protein [Geoalkalibacter halelectricus]MDO3379026.1 ATP-binding protein [Geoalkalibacter halelectricus]UWZ78840.1 ATP-binding protein [Geoalkalibacter halelectricus]
MHRKLRNIFYEVRDPVLGWDDIGGYADVKETLREMVCLPLKKPELIRRHNLGLPSGVMLWGPLGTGITMLAEACAKDAGVSFVYISGQEMLGKGEELVEAFDCAIHEAPCVLFISDCEWLAPRAGCDYEWGPGNFRAIPPTFADKELTRLFIEQIDRINAVEGVMLLGSCYRIDTVDQAVIKEKKRFNRKVFVHPPNAQDRLGMLEIYLRAMPNLAADIDPRSLAEAAEGYVGWDIESLCKRATVNAIKEDATTVTRAHFEKALKEIRQFLTPDMTAKYFQIREMDCPHHYEF